MPLFSGWINRLTEHAKEEIGGTIRGLLLYAVAGAAALATLVFITLAGFWALEQILPPIATALIVAGAYALVAVIFLAWAMSDKHHGSQPAEMSTPLQAVDNPDAAAVDVSRTMGVDIDDVAQTLAAAGYRAESLAVMAASDVAKQLSPLQFLCLVFVGSFFFGRRLRR